MKYSVSHFLASPLSAVTLYSATFGKDSKQHEAITKAVRLFKLRLSLFEIFYQLKHKRRALSPRPFAPAYQLAPLSCTNSGLWDEFIKTVKELHGDFTLIWNKNEGIITLAYTPTGNTTDDVFERTILKTIVKKLISNPVTVEIKG